MSHAPELEFAARTDTGLVRSQNEDAIAISPSYGIAILADGMGGYNAGEVASRIAVEITRQVLEEGIDRLQEQQATSGANWGAQLQQLLDESIHRANAAVLEAAASKSEYNGMGTTIVAAVLHHSTITIAHVGDSRAYRLRQDALVQITRDHSLLQEQIDAGLISTEQARYAPNSNLVTRAVGVAQEIEVEVHEHRMEPGDVYLLCSDGLSDMLQLEEIQDVLNGQPASLEEVCEAMVRRANDNGGHDNISVVLIKAGCSDVEAIVSEQGSLFRRILDWIS
ncbi:MAG TPA: Stp1/IreP family PP2C-type Ser/Thr phosphatase [Noviherbaspirillum sp.]|nr:Stp1/IreP family PP2C-type Ser/Thr phosphatase [Noviherbaspirillum sp.]